MHQIISKSNSEQTKDFQPTWKSGITEQVISKNLDVIFHLVVQEYFRYKVTKIAFYDLRNIDS